MMSANSSNQLATQSLTISDLLQRALENKEGILSNNGAFVVDTGARTGRSPKDRFIVQDPLTKHTVAWGKINQPISTENFNALWQRVAEYLTDKPTYQGDFAVGADAKYQIPVNVTTELAWHLAFCHNLFIRDIETKTQPGWTIVNAANFKTDAKRDGVNSDATIILNFSERKLLICGTHYAGEMKKGMFTVLNYLLPEKNVLPMHCSANMGENDDVALFFGLSGTGKTTLSADENRLLIGDDEHGWSENGIFNFEGGCYAKCIKLSQKNEPIIWQAIGNGTVLENVSLNASGIADYDNDTHTQNTRAAYPLTHIKKRVLQNAGGKPQAIIFLTCDLYGVLPPVAKLTQEQAAYYFLSGYTALVGSTEVGSKAQIQPVFSTCFGAPFFPRPASIYANLLLEKLYATHCPVYLVNTGWSGGTEEKGGQRFSIPTTRAIIDAIVNQTIEQSDEKILPHFNFSMPTSLPNVDQKLLDPRITWQTQKDYQYYTTILIKAFQDNFQQYDVAKSILEAGPTL